MKITIEQQEKGQKLHNELVQKAWESATFKEQLVSNPEATIAEVLGVESKTSDDVKFIVEDQTDPNTIYLNIPVKINSEDFELTEEQLESVAGGAPAPPTPWGVAIVAGLALGGALRRLYNDYVA